MAGRHGFWLRLRWRCYKLDVWHAPRAGYYPVTLTTYRGVRVARVCNFTPPERHVKKKNQSVAGGDSPFKHLAAMESKVLDKFFNLVAHCAITKYDDGDPRRPGWITLKTMGSAWVLEAKDPDSCSRMTASAGTLDDALTLLDLLLGSEEAPWEPDPWLRQQQKGKK